jgi:hypothetical protein
MHTGRVGPSVFAILTILVLLVLGFVAYAVPASGAPGQPSQGSGNTQGAGPNGNGLSFALLPTPAYLNEQTPANYSFKQGGALVVASGDQLQVMTSFIGAPKTTFATVVQTESENYTVGSVTTGAGGVSAFKGNLTLQPGTYEVGLLIFVSGQSASPVGISVPRAIQVTLPTTAQAPNSTPSTTPPPQATSQLTFTPVTVSSAPASYSYGGGGGRYALVGGTVYFSLDFSGQIPSTQYSLVLSVNGSAKTIGQYTTDSGGRGNVTANSQLGPGTFLLGLSVVDSSTFPTPTAVLASVPSNFTVTTGPAPSSSGAPTPARGLLWSFKLVPEANQTAPEGYRFPTTGTAVVSLNPRSSELNVVLGFQDANPTTTYDAALVLNGSSVGLGTMTTNRAGGAVLHASVQESPGVYLIGVVVYDVSNAAGFKAAGPVLVLVSDPRDQLITLVPPNAVGVSVPAVTSESLSSTASSTTSTATAAAVTIAAGNKVQTQIQEAVDSLTIPATVQVTPLSSSTTVLDSRFSLSVGPQVGNGLVIAISGENVTGPRVLLINMSKTSPLALYPALNVTLDGSPVAEASSAIQVLNPVSTNPPLYVLVATSDSIQLLVSIPHFSLHLVQVAGVVVHSIESSLELDAPILAGSVVVVTLAILAAYAARKRYLSVLL